MYSATLSVEAFCLSETFRSKSLTVSTVLCLLVTHRDHSRSESRSPE